jgi:GT2 family glycosyltransferase
LIGDNGVDDSQMQFTPLVSVAIVNFNCGQLLASAVGAALSSPVSVEVIVADNGSSDGSLAFLRSRFGTHPRVRIIENRENLGFARANNGILRHAKGQYILLLNPDCVVYPDTITRMLTAMEAYPKAGVGGCMIRNPDGTEQAGARRAVPTPWRTFVRVLRLNRLFPDHPRFRSFDLNREPLPDGPASVEAISGAFMLVRREVLEQVGPLDEGYFLHCEDLDWCMRFRQAGWQVMFVPAAEAVHWKGACSFDRPIRVMWHKHRGMVRYYRKFFRHQYPAPLMCLVTASVWARFCILAAACKVRQGSASFVVPTEEVLERAMAVRGPVSDVRLAAYQTLRIVEPHGGAAPPDVLRSGATSGGDHSTYLLE